MMHGFILFDIHVTVDLPIICDIYLQDYTANVDANVKLSRKYSVPLTDITALSQDPNVSHDRCGLHGEFRSSTYMSLT